MTSAASEARLLAGVLIAITALTGCVTGTGSPNPALSSTAATTQPTRAPVELTILGAASLKGVLAQVKATYEAANAGMTLVVSTDSSAALETKIEQGAPADVFLSADTSNPQKLIDGGFGSDPPVIFATNKLTVIVPKDNRAAIETPADLARPGVDVIAAGDAVPITKYATQLVQNLAKEAGYPARFEAAYAANVVSKEENVAAIVGKIALGQGDAGIVYVTDAASSTDVLPIEVPASANIVATYGGVLVTTSKHEAEARAFLAWLAGPSGQEVLAGVGFLPPTP